MRIPSLLLCQLLLPGHLSHHMLSKATLRESVALLNNRPCFLMAILTLKLELCEGLWSFPSLPQDPPSSASCFQQGICSKPMQTKMSRAGTKWLPEGVRAMIGRQRKPEHQN